MEGGSPQKIILNVGGVRFETYCDTFKAFPGTKLCSLTEPQASETFDYDPNSKEFFFDRSAKLFAQVFGYCQTGHLHRPADVCRSAVREELAFWEINLSQLPICCWVKLVEPGGQLEEFNAEDIKEEEQQQEEEEEDSQVLLDQLERRNGRCRAWRKPQLWALFEKPLSSRYALCLAITSLLLNIGLIILFSIESYNFIYYVNSSTEIHGSHQYQIWRLSSSEDRPLLLYLELLLILWFTSEFVLRLALCPDKKKFVRKPLNVVDFLSLFPVFIQLFSGPSRVELHLVAWLDFFRILYILKLLKAFRLVETPLMLKVLCSTFQSILREVLIFMTIVTFEIVFFGLLFCYAEKEYNSESIDVQSSLWWAVSTLTTVGYGDVLPYNIFSHLVAACTALCGVGTIIIPIPVFFIKFKGCYEAAVVKEKMKMMKKPTA